MEIPRIVGDTGADADAVRQRRFRDPLVHTDRRCTAIPRRYRCENTPPSASSRNARGYDPSLVTYPKGLKPLIDTLDLRSFRFLYGIRTVLFVSFYNLSNTLRGTT